MSIGPDEVEKILRAAASAADDDEADDRARAARDTAATIAAGRFVTGARTLNEVSGEPKLGKTLGQWFGLDRPGRKTKTPGPTVHDELVALGKTTYLFHDTRDRAYARLMKDGHGEVHLVKSRAFIHYLQRAYHERNGTYPARPALRDAAETLAAIASLEGAEEEVFLRVAPLNDDLYLDIGDPNWRVVRVTPGSFSILNGCACHFVRPAGKLALPEPSSGGNPDDWARFLNIPDTRDQLVVRAWMHHCLLGRGPFPVLILNGEQGSAKSTTARMLQRLIDPTEVGLRTPPADPRDLVIAASNSYLIAIDNMSTMSAWLSDGLCRLSTGSGFATRQLYTDDLEVLFSAQRPVLLNGIDDLATRGDLADRAITLELPVIPPDQRRTEHELWSEFDAAKGNLFGRLLLELCGILLQRPSVRLGRSPRMADFAVTGVALERVLGLPTDTFLRAYEANRTATDATSLESQPVAQAIIAFMSSQTAWQGTAGQLLLLLDADARFVLSTADRAWPRDAARLGNALRRAAPALRRAGVAVAFERAGHNRDRIIQLGKSGL